MLNNTQPSQTASKGAVLVAKGLGFESQVAEMLNAHQLINASSNSLTLVKNICNILEIDINTVKNVVAYRQHGTKKADVIMCMIFEDFSMKEINISIKGTIQETQFANIKTENFVKHIPNEEAKVGYQKFTGYGIFKEKWHEEYGHENRNRYYKSELTINNRHSMYETSLSESFREPMFDAVFGDKDNCIDIILAPKVAWDLDPNNLLIINAQKVRTVLTKRYNLLPFTFMNTDILKPEQCYKVISKINKDGKPITPEGEGGLNFANDIIKLKRKGSENSIKDGFDPTDLQLICSVKSLYELQHLT